MFNVLHCHKMTSSFHSRRRPNVSLRALFQILNVQWMFKYLVHNVQSGSHQTMKNSTRERNVVWITCPSVYQTNDNWGQGQVTKLKYFMHNVTIRECYWQDWMQQFISLTNSSNDWQTYKHNRWDKAPGFEKTMSKQKKGTRSPFI